MLRSRHVGCYILYGLRRSSASSTPRHTRNFPLQSSQSRAYSANGKRYQDSKLARPVYEDTESISKQSWRSYTIPSGLLLFAGAATFIYYNDEKRAISKDSTENSLPERVSRNRPAIGGPFSLYDTENNLVTESNLRGNWTIMYFGYTSCPDVGPQEIRKMAEAITILEFKYNFKITPVFVTIDPQRDLPAQLKAYNEEFDPRIIGLTGPITAVRHMAQEYRVFFKKVDEIGQDYLVECSHNMYLLDPNLETVRCFGVEYDSLELADSIMVEVSKAKK